jgi:hypothetical protein
MGGSYFQFFQDLLALLPPWAAGPVVAVVVVALLPGFAWRVRSRQLKGLVRRAAYTDDPGLRASLHSEALALAGDKPRQLVFLAEESHRVNQHALFREARERLGSLPGADPADLRRLDAAVAPERPKALHPTEEALVVERLLAERLDEAARLRLEDALRRFPDDPDLRSLAERVR